MPDAGSEAAGGRAAAEGGGGGGGQGGDRVGESRVGVGWGGGGGVGGGGLVGCWDVAHLFFWAPSDLLGEYDASANIDRLFETTIRLNGSVSTCTNRNRPGLLPLAAEDWAGALRGFAAAEAAAEADPVFGATVLVEKAGRGLFGRGLWRPWILWK